MRDGRPAESAHESGSELRGRRSAGRVARVHAVRRADLVAFVEAVLHEATPDARREGAQTVGELWGARVVRVGPTELNARLSTFAVAGEHRVDAERAAHFLQSALHQLLPDERLALHRRERGGGARAGRNGCIRADGRG